VTGGVTPVKKSCLTSHFDGEYSATENGSTTLKVDKKQTGGEVCLIQF
jgi:hypothetical protein